MILLQDLNIPQSYLIGIIGTLLTGFLGFIAWVWNNNRQENKDRIDARSAEIAENSKEINELKTLSKNNEIRIVALENDHKEIKQMIQNNHQEITRRFDLLFQELRKK